MNVPHLLLLGGTTEARQLAEALPPGRVKLTVSLAGRTHEPRRMPGRLRVGGFGGWQRFSDYIDRELVDAVVDATHPFATTISANAVRASNWTGCPLLQLQRPPWSPKPGETWRRHADLGSVFEDLPPGARVLLTTGSGSAKPLRSRADLHLVLRSIEPVANLPDNVIAVNARPPFTLAEERDLMRAHRITHLVTKNAGGAAGRSKIEAAASLGLPIMVIERPALPDGPDRVANVAAVIGWLTRLLALDTPIEATP